MPANLPDMGSRKTPRTICVPLLALRFRIGRSYFHLETVRFTTHLDSSEARLSPTACSSTPPMIRAIEPFLLYRTGLNDSEKALWCWLTLASFPLANPPSS